MVNQAPIPHGYKKTQVGVIPNDWEVKTIKELYVLKNGINADQKKYGTGIKFINVLEVITKNSMLYEDIPGFVSITPETVKTYLVKKGDVLFNRTSETQEEVGLASVYLDDNEVVFGGFVIRAQPIDNSIDCFFSKYIFLSKSVRKDIIKRGQGAIRANIGQNDLYKVKLPLPPLSEQRAIAEVLKDIDDLISALDRLIDKKRNIKQGAMQQLLTGKKRLPGFSGKWETKKLGEIAEIRRGASPRPIDDPIWFSSSGRGWIRITDVTRSNIFLNETTQYLSKLGVERSVKVDKGELIMSICATIGIPVILNIDACIHDGFVLFRDYEKELDKLFLLYLLKKSTKKLADSGQSGTQKNLNTAIINNFQIPLPPLAEQEAIARVLSDMDAEIEALEKKREKYTAIKNGMMHELLTGKTRI